jgi:hypothetical protein
MVRVCESLPGWSLPKKAGDYMWSNYAFVKNDGILAADLWRIR